MSKAKPPKGKARAPRPRRKAETPKTPSARAKFIALLAKGLSVTTAATGAGVSRATVYRWRDEAEAAAANGGPADTFPADWDAARQEGLDRLEDRALKLAHAGSEKLIMFMLKAGRPEKYRETYKHEHGGAGIPIILYRDDEAL